MRSDWRHLGGPRAIARASYKIANRVGHLDLFRLMELREENVAIPSETGARALEARFVEPGEMPSLCEQYGDVLRRRFVDLAIAKGDDCYAFFDGAICAAFTWYSRKPTITRDNVLLRFDPAWLYMYHGFTHPDYRGRKLHAIAIGKRALHAFETSSVRGMISIAEEVNYRTHHSAYRLGFQDRGRLWRIGVGGLTRLGASAGCAGYGATLEEVDDPFALPGDDS